MTKQLKLEDQQVSLHNKDENGKEIKNLVKDKTETYFPILWTQYTLFVLV